MIDHKRLERLVQLMIDNDLSELDLRDKDETVTLKRVGSAPTPGPTHPAPAAPTEGAGSSGPPPGVDDRNDGLIAVESPMVGTFYTRPNPESDPFVKVGAAVGPDSVVCLIEAMKVFNEVQAGAAGTIERIVVEDGEPVEFGQRLFLIRPN